MRFVLIHPYNIWLELWSVQTHLPLHLCGLSSLLSGIVLFKQNQLLYELLFFWGIPGAFHSLLTPEFTSGTTGLLYVEYFISHGGIILSAIYLTIILGMRPRQGSWWKVWLYSQILLPIIGGFNWILDANYMYLCEAPIVKNPFIFTTNWPWYLLGIEIIALLHFIIIYIPFGSQKIRFQSS